MAGIVFVKNAEIRRAALDKNVKNDDLIFYTL